MVATQAKKRVGEHTLVFMKPPRIISSGTAVGPREGEGTFGRYFDEIEQDHMHHEKTPERAERQFFGDAIRIALDKANLDPEDVQFFLGGDLLNQIIPTTFTARSLSIPYMGLFNACATVAEGLILGASLVDGDFAERVIVGASSHYQSVERQYRYPIELNIQRKATNQWTVTGAGAAILGAEGDGPKITMATVGRVIDYGLKDPNDMGSAMAPAAADTFLRHLRDTGRTPGDYDLILTGDLAAYGKKMFKFLVDEEGITLGGKHQDCGDMMFKPQQQSGAGASGAGCSAAVIFSYVVKEMLNTRYHRVLVLPTGSLHSPVSFQQGESIPCVAHAVVLEI